MSVISRDFYRLTHSGQNLAGMIFNAALTFRYCLLLSSVDNHHFTVAKP